MSIRYGSVCSGIEVASVAWHPLGWRADWLSEIERFPSAVLAHHYPDVPNLGDMTRLPRQILTGEIAAPDVLVGGTPCQAFSVAGLREGLADERGQLTIKYVELADAIDLVRGRAGRPASILVWENVPGVLSSKDNAFGCFLGALAGEDEELQPPGKKWENAGCVFGPARTIAWRVLDAQYFGLAQRRRRVFVVASARKGFDPVAVLFEFDGVRRDSAPSRETGKAVAALAANGVGTCGADDNQGQAGHLIAAFANQGNFGGLDAVSVGDPLRAKGGDAGNGSETIVCMAHGQGGAEIAEDRTPTLTCNHEAPIAVYSQPYQPVTGSLCAHALGRNNGGENAVLAFSCKDYGADASANLAPTLRAMGHSGSHANAGGQLAVCVTGEVTHTLKAEGFDASEDGTGRGQPIIPTYSVSLRGREGGATAELGGDLSGCLRASSGGGDKPHVLTVAVDTLYDEGIRQGHYHASSQEADPREVLRTLLREIGEEAFTEWGLGILMSLQQKEVLRQALHGCSVRPAAFSRSWVVYCALSRPENRSGWLLQSLREVGCARCASQGWEPPEQCDRELGAYLSELSQPGAQSARLMRDLWFASEGPGLLQQALLAVQEVGRPANGETQSAHRTLSVRRLTVEECEFLQGFPRGHTDVPYRGKPAADGPRYKAIGNSMAVPCMAWIGKRIAAQLEKLK